MKNKILWILLPGIIFGSLVPAQSNKSTKKIKPTVVARDTNAIKAGPLITFIELGSVRCIPCKAMQPVMKSVEEKYGSQIKVVFYDVWKEDQAHYGQDYKIRIIPTQIFLDARGKELMRHEGFFPEKEIDKFLQSKGLKLKTGKQG